MEQLKLQITNTRINGKNKMHYHKHHTDGQLEKPNSISGNKRDK